MYAKLPIIILGLVTSVVVADLDPDQVAPLIESIPPCAAECLLLAIDEAGCGLTNYACQCENRAVVAAQAVECLPDVCEAAQIAETSEISGQICELYEESKGEGGSGTASNSTTTSPGSATSTGTSSSESDSAEATGTDSAAGTNGGTRASIGFGILVGLALAVYL